MTLFRAAFNTYEVISLCNVHLGDDSVVEAIGMVSIVIGVETKDETTTIRMTDLLHMLKLQANLLTASKLFLKGLKVRFHVNKCFVGGANGDMVAIARREEICIKRPSRRYAE